MVVKKKAVKLKEMYKKGFLSEVRNPRGERPPVYIYQGSRPGFSARYEKSGRAIPGSSMDAEAYARRLAKKGHKKVTFHD